jgi:PEP-CTERM motif
MTNSKLTAGVCVSLGFLLATSLASAASVAPELKLHDAGGDTITIQGDGTVTYSPTCTNCVGTITAANGQITYNGTLGNFSSLTVGIATPGSTPSQDLYLNSIDIRATGAGSLDVSFSDTGFTSPGTFTAPYNISVGSGTADLAAYLDPSNKLMAETVSLADTGTLSGPGAYNGTLASSVIAPSSPYSLTEVMSLTFTRSATEETMGTFSVNTVPEPSSFALVLMAAGVGVAGLRKRLCRG